MVAHRSGAETSLAPASVSKNRLGETGNHWRLIQRCQTLEAAQALMAQLEQQGRSPRLIMDDGISIVAPRF